MKNCDLLNSFAVEEPEMPEEITQHQYRENNAQGRTAQVTHINVCCTESRKHDAIAESKQSRNKILTMWERERKKFTKEINKLVYR